MIPVTQQTDSNGRTRVALAGQGFSVRPGGSSPGYFPVTVIADSADGEMRFVVRDSGHKPTPRPFVELRIEDAPVNSTFDVTVTAPGETGPGASSTLTRSMQRVSAAAGDAVPQVAPAAASDGYEIAPDQTAWSFFFSGVLGNVQSIYQMDPDGNWFDTGDTIDPATETVAARQVLAPDGRIALKSVGAGTVVRVFRTLEVRS